MQTRCLVELAPGVVWHGRAEDASSLLASVLAHCQCRVVGPASCAAHQLLADQHALDHLAFARSVRQRLLAEEALPAVARTDGPDWSALLARCRATAARRPASRQPGLGTARAVVLSVLGLALVVGGLSGPRHRVPTPTQPRPLASWSTR